MNLLKVLKFFVEPIGVERLKKDVLGDNFLRLSIQVEFKICALLRARLPINTKLFL